jgi:Flp pilus assembly protein TadG
MCDIKSTLPKASTCRHRENERGVTLLIVTAAMISLLTMAVLALDVVSLYVSKDQAQHAADAAALAGAQALALSGTTSAPAVLPRVSVCNGSSGNADLWAKAVAGNNQIAGFPPTTVTTQCPSSAPDHNPQIQVTITRTGLPTFFARIFGPAAGTVSATATAEAYNPSFDPANPTTTPPIQIQGVKPWLVFNCNTCPSGPAFLTSQYGIANGGLFIGQQWTFTLIDASTPTPPNTSPPANTTQFYAIDPPAPSNCPSNGATSCNQVGTGSPRFYHDNIACTGSFKFSNGQFIGPGQPIQVDTRSLGVLKTRTQDGTDCLIHAATGWGLGLGQDSFTTGLPVTITGGSNNPDSTLANVSGIHRSDSVVTVPVFNCPIAPPCDNTAQLPIVGFLQLGIQDIKLNPVNPNTVDIDAVILNAAGADPANVPTPLLPAVTGSGSSPIPVRLMQ